MTDREIEKAYMKQIEDEKPDLWQRIETGIEAAGVPVREAAAETKTEKGKIKVETGFLKKLSALLFGGSTLKTAAVLCCCFLVIYGAAGQLGSRKYATGAGSAYNYGIKSENAMVEAPAAAPEEAEGWTNDMEMEFESPMEDIGEMSGSTAEAAMDVADTSRKMIRTINMDVQTLEFDAMISRLQSEVSRLGGYIESSSINGNNYYYSDTRDAYMTLRIPQDRTDDFLNMVSGSATVVSKTEDVEDVTLQYVDIESHVKALETEEKTLMDLLEQAQSLDDVFAIQSELSYVRYQLESYKSQLRTYDNRVSYDTVSISIEEVKEIEPGEEPTFFQRIGRSFSSGIESFFYSIQSLVVDLVYSLPFIAAFFVAVVIVLTIMKAVVKKIRKK